jgi:hypothetical protein
MYIQQVVCASGLTVSRYEPSYNYSRNPQPRPEPLVFPIEGMKVAFYSDTERWITVNFAKGGVLSASTFCELAVQLGYAD